MSSFEFERSERRSTESSTSATEERTIHYRIATTLRRWADQHPSPNMPALSLAEMGEFSPRQICEAVDAGTDVGQFIEVLIVNGVHLHPDGIDGVLRSFVESEPVAMSSPMSQALS